MGHTGRGGDDADGRVPRQHLAGVEDLGGAVVGAEEVVELPDYVGLPAFVAGGSEGHFFVFELEGFGRVVCVVGDVGGVRRLLVGEWFVEGVVNGFGL